VKDDPHTDTTTTKKYKTYPGKPKGKKSLKHKNRENHNIAMIVG